MVTVYAFLVAGSSLLFLTAGITAAFRRAHVGGLREKARRGDMRSSALYAVTVQYTHYLVLAFIAEVLAIAAMYAGCLTLLGPAMGFAATLAGAAYVWLWATAIGRQPKSFFSRLAAGLSPGIYRVMNGLYPILRPLSRLAGSVAAPGSLRLANSKEVIKLLEKQRKHTKNQARAAELGMIISMVGFADKTVEDVFLPKKAVRQVKSDELVGPLLLDELYKTGQTQFPVVEADDGLVIGVLDLWDVHDVRDQGGNPVSTYMRRDITYMHEEATLHEALQAFVRTRQHTYVVINSFEEFSGIVTVEDIVAHMTGGVPEGAFDQYDNISAVARHAEQAARQTRSKRRPGAKPASGKDSAQASSKKQKSSVK